MTAVCDPPTGDATIRRGLSRRGLILGYLANVFFCAIFALVLVQVSDMTIGHTLVYSEAIGMSIMTLVVLYFSAMARYGVRPEGLGFVLRIVGAGLLTIPGYMIGSLIAHALLGMPLFPVILPIPGMQDESIVGELVASVIATVVFSAFHFTYRRNVELKLDASRASQVSELAMRQAADSRLALLRAQVDPHMLFNTLATVRALVRADPLAAQQMLDRLIDFYRATLGTSRDPISTVAREFAMLEDYLGLMQVRLGPRLSYQLSVGPGTGALALPALLLQPLVENAIRHAIEPSKEGGSVRVSSLLEAGVLHLQVQDTGIGLSDSALARARQLAGASSGDSGQASITDPADALRAGTSDPNDTGSGGMGLGLLAERLRSTHGKLAGFEVTRPATGGTRIDIWLPGEATTTD